jgi:hypothetical protein
MASATDEASSGIGTNFVVKTPARNWKMLAPVTLEALFLGQSSKDSMLVDRTRAKTSRAKWLRNSYQ